MRINRKHSRLPSTRARLALVFAALGALLMSSGLVVMAASPASAAQSISAKALTGHDCDSTEWHFVITQVEPAANAPASISVNFANGQALSVSLEKVSGKTAHYRTTLNLDSTVTSATTTIYDAWDGQFNLSHGPCSTLKVTPVAPTVVQSSQCEVEGSYTIPTTTGVKYQLDGKDIAAGQHAGPASGKITAVATGNLPLSDQDWSFTLSVPAAADCDTVTPVAPTVVQSSQCEVEGSYTIPTTTGVKYLLSGSEIAAGLHSGPASGTITAVATGNLPLSDQDWSFALNVPAAADCGSSTPPTTPVTDVCPNLDGPQTSVPDGYTLNPGGQCIPDVQPATDICPNVEGDQASVPPGLEFRDGECLEPVVKGVETIAPNPSNKPGVHKPSTTRPAVVAGTQAAIPTGADAGLATMSTASSGSVTTLLAQLLVAGGLLLLVTGGCIGLGRRTRGVHEA